MRMALGTITALGASTLAISAIGMVPLNANNSWYYIGFYGLADYCDFRDRLASVSRYNAHNARRYYGSGGLVYNYYFYTGLGSVI